MTVTGELIRFLVRDDTFYNFKNKLL